MQPTCASSPLCNFFFAFKPSYHQVAFNPFCKRDFHYLHIKRPTYLKQQKKRIGALSNFIQKKSLPFQKRMKNMQLKFSSSNKQISKNEKKNVLDWLMSCYILIFSVSFNGHLALYCVVYAHDFFRKCHMFDNFLKSFFFCFTTFFCIVCKNIKYPHHYFGKYI